MLLRRQPLAGVSALAALACAATAVFTTPAAHATTTAGATRVEAPAIHAMPTIHDARIPATQAGDCVLPVVVGVVCVGVGTPMTYGGGPIETQPGIYLVFWG